MRGEKMLAKIGAGILLIIIFLMSYLRVKYSSHFAGSWDEVDFSLALDRFDLLSMQPHFPGYPYFILGGMIIHQWEPDPAKSLALFNSLMLFLASIPIFLLAKRFVSSFNSLVICTAVQSLSYFWIMATESMSEATAVSVLWWYLWSLQCAKEKKSTRIFFPLFLFSILMGVRLSYLPFGIGLVLLVLSKRELLSKEQRFSLYILRQAVYAIMFQLIWVWGLVATEGNISNFLVLSHEFVLGHFNEWGGAVTASSIPVYERFFRLVFFNILWIGVCGQSKITAILLGSLVIMGSFQAFKEKIFMSPIIVSFMILFGSYFLWALFAQNIDKPRHALPLVALLSLSIFIGALSSNKDRSIKLIIILIIICFQSIIGYNYVKEKYVSEPATYQLANYLSSVENQSFVVYTWEEARIMDYLKVDYPYERIYTYDYFSSNMKQRRNKKIYITDQVVKGFQTQGIVVDNRIKKIKTFHSNSLFDPVYNQITLYEWR